MANQSWLETVERELVRRGLPGWRVGRMVEELHEHLYDLEQTLPGTEPATSAAERLGSPAELADAAWENHVAGSYFGRHPVIGFVALPIPITILGWALMVMAAVLLFRLGDWLEAPAGTSVVAWPAAVYYLAVLLDLAVRIVPPALAAFLYGSWAHETARGWKWHLAACLLVAVVAGLYHSSLQFPLTPGTGHWQIGFGAPGGRDQLLQLMIPLAVGFWSIYRTRSVLAATRAVAVA